MLDRGVLVRWLLIALALLLPLGASAETSLEGLYEVQGVIKVDETGEERAATGTVVVHAEEDGTYTTSFNIKTALPTPEGTRKLDITGNGTIRPEGDAYVGDSEGQWLMAAISGIDPQFAFIPGQLGPRIVSSFEMRPSGNEDEYDVLIKTRGAEGEAGKGHQQTTTTLVSRRVGDKPEGKKLPLPKPHDD